ncbi:MAG: DNA recombination/repair protein RecA [Deltaproteobacteria bacterium]|nr:DNA recombination/repair protein RecA [Deltaproteobacteria bacterium]
MAEQGVPEKAKALDQALGQIEKAYGKGAIMRLGADEKIDVAVIPTGCISLDLALGIGGIPRGRVIEIFGPESSGKTTLALHAIAEAQKLGGVAAFVDAEHALDVQYARKLGVRTEDLLISQPDSGEQALEIAEILVRSNAVDMLVVDSVAALVPRSEIEGEMGDAQMGSQARLMSQALRKLEIEGEMGDAQMGSQARLMSQALRKLTATIGKTRTSVIFINQIRHKIGVRFGNPETTTGGNALKFYASLRMDIRRISAIKEGNDVVGYHTRVKVVKNKLAPPFREAEFDIIFGQGISKEGDLLDLASAQGLITKSGAWYSLGSERMAQGRENAKTYLRDHPEVTGELERQIRSTYGLIPKVAIPEEQEAP